MNHIHSLAIQTELVAGICHPSKITRKLDSCKALEAKRSVVLPNTAKVQQVDAVGVLAYQIND
jgi:hypothetical protein